MFEVTKYYPNIRVELEPGIYRLNSDSGQGKTWLASVLAQYCSFGEPVNSYSYTDYKRGLSLDTILNKEDLKLLVIDRYDMLPPELSELIDKVQDKIVLLDCKHGYSGRRRSYSCNLQLKENLFRIIK